MSVTITVSNRLLQTVTSGKWSGQGLKGFLIGDLDYGSSEPQTILAVWQSTFTDHTEIKEEIDECLSHFPGGKNVVGLILLPSSQPVKSFEEDDKAVIEKEFEETFGSYSNWLEQMGLVHAVVLCLWRQEESDEHCKYSFFMLSEDSVTKPHINHDLSSKPLTRFRLKADIPLLISTESNSEEQLKSALDHELMKLQNHAQSGNFSFGFDENRIILPGKHAFIDCAVEWNTCKDIGKHFVEQDKGMSGRKRGAGTQQTPIAVSLLQQSTIESPVSLQYAPIIRHNIGTFKTISLSASLDLLVEVDENMPAQELPQVLNESLTRQIASVFHCLSVCSMNNKLSTAEVFHFKPPCLDTSVTAVYAKGATEKELENQRRILHQHLCLPLTQPWLRRGAAGYFLLRQTSPGGYLLNTHLGIPDPPIKGATISLVEGFYSYHHYMQDHFDDDKWGCAYRSLQTIVSWFKYQGYTDRDIPSHKDIQQALYEIGDKNKMFVGSRQWIGSFEVSYVLDHLLGVVSKFISVNSGSELSAVGQGLTNHFQTQGTPVMIGGGVLAHTILGVAYNEMTGDINFLVLDPHYTGSEDIRTIQDKGWCGWKDVNFWNQTAHYNMCLPQRPITL